MPEEIHLVTELAIILIAASIFTIITKALKQPLILGYIIAGFLVGPKLGLFPQFSAESIHEWSEIGIIFLLFGLGLEFSFKKLLKVGSSALITAVVKCVGMFVVGFITGRLLGWSDMESTFLGGILGMSSTTIIIKAYSDMGLKEKPYAPLIFGSLVFEDLIAVLLMVLLSTLAVTGRFAGAEMLGGLGKLAFFIVLWFIIGIYLIPLILKKAEKYLTDEILLLAGLGLCFGMVVFANAVGFSSALGAFVMGSILAETVKGEKIEHITSSIKDLFGAIFFVSVGMMVDPAIIAQYWLVILVITVVVILGILVFSTLGAILAGQGLNTAVHAGFTLAQLGEFGFILAGLGCSLGVMRDFIYPVIIAVSVITTFTTPYMIKLAEPAFLRLQKVIPPSILERINSSESAAAPNGKASRNELNKACRAVLIRVGIYSVVVIGINILSNLLLGGFPAWIQTLITIVVEAPFLYGIALSGNDLRITMNALVGKDKENRWAVLALVYMRVLVSVLFAVYIVDSRLDLKWWGILLLIAAVIVFYQLSRHSVHTLNRLESVFLGNLNEKEKLERLSAPVTHKVNDALKGYDVTIHREIISPDFQFIGRPLREMPFRKTSGVNIIKISRGSRDIEIPSGDEIIYPGDLLLAVGTREQIASFRAIMEANTSVAQREQSDFTVSNITLDDESLLSGQTLRSADMRASGCMIVSVLRDGNFMTNPAADFRLAAGDVIWIAGDKDAVNWYTISGK